MPSQSGSDVKLEIGHVLFIDIVGYSKLLIDDQREVLQQLNQIARNTESFRAAEAANKLVRLPTGDGALVFFTTPEAPMQILFLGLYLIPAFFRPHFGPPISSDFEDRGKEIACRPKPM